MAQDCTASCHLAGYFHLHTEIEKGMSNLKRLRNEKGLTQAEVAEKLPIGQAEYARIEKGVRSPGKHALAIAQVFGVDVDSIYDDSPAAEKIKQTDCVFYAFPTPDGAGIHANAMHSRCPLPPYDEAIGEWGACICPADTKSLKRGDLLYYDTGAEVAEGDPCVVLTNENVFRIYRYMGGTFYLQNGDEHDLEGIAVKHYKIMLYMRRFF